MRRTLLTALSLACAALLSSAPARAELVRIYITNSAGDSIHVIDPATNKVVQEIKGIEAAHGIGFAPDGSKVYVSNEADSTLDVFDRESGKLIKKIPLSDQPNNIAVAKDGDRIVVAIARGRARRHDRPATLTLKKTIPVHGRLHNIYVTPDGKYAVMGSIPKKLLTVIDLATEEIAWELKIIVGVRPMTIEANADGSTRRIFVQLSDFNGFAVVDFADPQGSQPDQAAEARRPSSRPTPGAPPRPRTASASRPTARPCGSPASRTTRSSSIRSPT